MMRNFIKKIAIGAALMLPMVLFTTNSVYAREIKATNEQELINEVKDVNKGWDWQPRCAGGAHWSWNENRCKGGTGHHKHHKHHHHHDD